MANRLIEGQVLNAQYAEESYQIKRENFNLKKEFSKRNSVETSDFLVRPEENELENLREAVERLNLVRRTKPKENL